MQDYTFLRELAGSLGTVFLVISFLGFVLYALRPGSRAVHEDTADIPFRHDDKPAPQSGDHKRQSDHDISAAHNKEARQ